jgi:hypothetical protein
MNDTNYIEWAREINTRWICHGRLPEAAAAWTDYLSEVDPARLAQSARRAFRLMMSAGPAVDPKPWFYAGLFSLAEAEERKTWLKDHPFTAAAISTEGYRVPPFKEKASLQLLGRIREVMEGLPREEPAMKKEESDTLVFLATGG